MLPHLLVPFALFLIPSADAYDPRYTERTDFPVPHIADTLPLHSARRSRYRYEETIDRIFELASIGDPGTDIRECKMNLSWILSVTMERIAQDSIRIQATVDSISAVILQAIPEYPIALPQMPERGTQFTGILVISTGHFAGAPGSVPTNDTTVPTALLQILSHAISPLSSHPSLLTHATSQDVLKDTTYAQQTVRRTLYTVPLQLGDFLFPRLLPILQAESDSDVQGSVTEYRGNNDHWVGRQMRHTGKFALPFKWGTTPLTILGTGADFASMELLP